jgi:hypothetical protein
MSYLTCVLRIMSRSTVIQYYIDFVHFPQQIRMFILVWQKFVKLPKSFGCLPWFVKSLSVCMYVYGHFCGLISQTDLDETLEINLEYYFH